MINASVQTPIAVPADKAARGGFLGKMGSVFRANRNITVERDYHGCIFDTGFRIVDRWWNAVVNGNCVVHNTQPTTVYNNGSILCTLIEPGTYTFTAPGTIVLQFNRAVVIGGVQAVTPDKCCNTGLLDTDLGYSTDYEPRPAVDLLGYVEMQFAVSPLTPFLGFKGAVHLGAAIRMATAIDDTLPFDYAPKTVKANGTPVLNPLGRPEFSRYGVNGRIRDLDFKTSKEGTTIAGGTWQSDGTAATSTLVLSNNGGDSSNTTLCLLYSTCTRAVVEALTYNTDPDVDANWKPVFFLDEGVQDIVMQIRSDFNSADPEPGQTTSLSRPTPRWGRVIAYRDDVSVRVRALAFRRFQSGIVGWIGEPTTESDYGNWFDRTLFQYAPAFPSVGSGVGVPVRSAPFQMNVLGGISHWFRNCSDNDLQVP